MFHFPPRRRAGGPTPGRLFDLLDLGVRPRVRNEAMIRSLCANAYLGEATALCRVLGRYKMFVDTTDISHSSHLLLEGYWEMWVTEAMAAVVKPGMTAVDVGANLGYFTLLLADLVGAGGVVHAFEPNPAAVARLRRSVRINGFGAWTHAHQVALSDRDDVEVDLIVPASEPMNAHVVPAADGPGPNAVRLRTRRLDACALGVVDFLKIDADTAEQAIWRGANGLFETRRPMTVFLEFAPVRYPDPGGFLDEIVAQGFTLSQIHFEGVRRATRESVLSAGPPGEDRMLALCRGTAPIPYAAAR
jgi:FkbM family methyltransferase